MKTSFKKIIFFSKFHSRRKQYKNIQIKIFFLQYLMMVITT